MRQEIEGRKSALRERSESGLYTTRSSAISGRPGSRMNRLLADPSAPRTSKSFIKPPSEVHRKSLQALRSSTFRPSQQSSIP